MLIMPNKNLQKVLNGLLEFFRLSDNFCVMLVAWLGLGLGLGAQVEFVSKIIFMRSPKLPSHNYKSLMISRLGCTKPHAVTRYISPSEVELPMGLREISQCPEKAPLATSLLGPSSC